MSYTLNLEGEEERKALARAVVAQFGLEAARIDKLAFDPACPFPFNNFLFVVTLASPATAETHWTGRDQPFTAPVPPEPVGGTTQAVVLMTNPRAMGLVQTNRVQNAVAALWLAREGLRAAYGEAAAEVVPRVFAWSDKDKSGGWLVMEHKSGQPLDEVYGQLERDQQQSVRRQVARIVAGLQQVPLPAGFGVGVAVSGLTIDGGRIVPGAMTLVPGGPWTSTARYWEGRIAAALAEADESSVVGGWRPGGVRARVERLVDDIDGQFEARRADGTSAETATGGRPALVHADLSPNNLLYDKASGRLTGIVDFDFAYIGAPSDEFLWSLTAFGEGEGAKEGWATALAEAGALQPDATTAEFGFLQQLNDVVDLVTPFRLLQNHFLKRMSETQIKEARKEAEDQLVSALQRLGF